MDLAAQFVRLTVGIALLLPFCAPAPVHAAFAARKVLTIDRTRVPGTANHTDFPVLVSLTALNLRSTANGGLVTSNLGHDILFRGEDTTTCSGPATCRLDHEIESYDPVTGTLVAWVRVPTLRYSGSGANTVIYLYFGDATVTCSQQNKAGVWNSGYREVLHLNAAGDQDDSTVNAFTAAPNGAVASGAAGQVGSALDFGGGATGLTPAYLNVSDGTLPTATSFTFETWVRFRSITASQYVGLVVKGRECLNFDGDPDPGVGFCTSAPCGDWTGLYKLPDGGGNEVLSFEWAYGTVCKAAGLQDPRGATANVTTGVWYHVAGSFDSATGTRRLLVNGTQVASDTVGACLEAAIPHYTRVGTDSNRDFLDGFLDEVRLSFVARSNGWITTGYNNQSAPGTFFLAPGDQAGPYAIAATACPALNPCYGGPGTCYLRSIGNTAPYTTGSGSCTATNGSTVVSCPGAGWQSANRGRGDRITIEATHYMVRSVDSETQLQLATPFAGTGGAGTVSYTMSRQFATLQQWEDCISTGGGACSYFGVANGNLVTGNRSEIGIVYEEGNPYSNPGSIVLLLNGSTTDAAHTITLTADGGNRHYGVSGAGVVIDNGVNANRAIVIEDNHVTVEWLEVRNGSGPGSVCIDFVPGAVPNKGVIRNNLVRNCSSQSIRLAGSAGAIVADISNNIVYRGAREAVRINVALGTGTGSRVNIFNNTFYRNNANTAQPWTEISTAETPNPYVVLRNNIMADDAQTPDSTWNGLALCTNAASCDWWNAASGHNATGDTLPTWPPAANFKSDIGPNPRASGLSAASEASLAFVNTGVGTENLHLLAGSAAWNRAATAPSVVSGDVDAQIRSGTWDIGADELPASSAPPLIVWSDVAVSAPRALRYSTLQGAAWTAPGSTAVAGPFTGGWPLFSKVARTHPNGSVRVAVTSENYMPGQAQLHASFFDGTNWDDGTGAPFGDAKNFGNALSPTPMTMQHFDAAYEQLSGKLLVVTGSNTDETVFIWTYNGTAWSANLFATPGGNGGMPNQGQDAGNTFRWVHLEPRPGTDQIAFIGSGLDTGTGDSSVVSAAIWNGATNTFGSKQILSFPVTGPDGGQPQNPHNTDAIDIDFVLGGANAGEAVAVWGTGMQLWRRIWNPGTGWASSANVMVQNVGATLRWIRQKAAANGDDMILALEDVNEAIHTIRYDGNTRSYSGFTTHTPDGYGVSGSNRPFDVVWDLGAGANNVMLVYSDTTDIWYRQSSDGGATWPSPAVALTGGAYQAHWVQLERDPSGVVHLVIKDQADDLRAWKWTGGAWTSTTPVLPSTNVESNGASQNVETFAIATYPPITVTTAVKLQSFEAVGQDGAVELSWRTGSELDNRGFHLYRGQSADGPWARLTASLVAGLGSSALGKAYSWRDSGLENGQRYYYRLEDVDTSGKSTFHGPVSAVPAAASPVAPPAVGGGRARKRRGDAKVPRNECPAWVLQEYAANVPADSTAAVECTKHGNPEAVSLEPVDRGRRSSLYELRTGGFYAVHEADGSVRAFIPGFDSPSDPEAPALPLRRALVEALVGHKARLAAVAARDPLVFAGLRPAALGKAAMEIGGDGTVRARRHAVRGLRARSGLVPQDVAVLAGTVFQGEEKSAVVELQPLRYDSRSNRLVLATRVRFRLDFSGRDPDEAGLGRRGRRRPPKPTPASNPVIAELHASRAGVHAVAFETLFPGGGTALATDSLALMLQGAPVPFHVEPRGMSFGPGSVLYYYVASAAASTAFSGELAYQLTQSAGGVAMDERGAAPRGTPLGSASHASAAFETNRIYQPGLLEARDPWLWESLPGGTVRVKPFALSGADSLSPLAARLAVELQGSTDSIETTEDHHVRVSVNGIDVGESFFDGKRPHAAGFTVPASLLREGTNELAVTNVGDTGVSSLLFLDRFTLDYPQLPRLREGAFAGSWIEAGTAELAGAGAGAVVLDVTEAAAGHVAWLEGAVAAPGVLRFEAQPHRRYQVASGVGLLAPRVVRPAASTLRDAANQADYLLVAPQDFLSAAEPLVRRRASQGLRARAVSFEEITSAFGFGQPSAEAIREFLRYAYHSWARPSPRYVLLLGDASYDPRNFTGTALASPLPASWVATSYLVTASDPWLAAVNGDDLLPDLAIGRLPARTPEEAEGLVAKVLAWEDSGQDLSGRALLVADNPDVAGDFEADIRDIAQRFLAEREVRLVHVGELGGATRPAILDAWNAGQSLVGYVGHGGAAVWASENVLNSWDVPSLVAQSRQPLLVTMNCLNGYFVAPNFDALGEALMKVEGRGAIAAFSPSGLSLDGPAHVLHGALMAELTRGGHQRLGDAVLAAQRAYAEAGPMPELLSIYHLFGDPALVIGR